MTEVEFARKFFEDVILGHVSHYHPFDELSHSDVHVEWLDELDLMGEVGFQLCGSAVYLRVVYNREEGWMVLDQADGHDYLDRESLIYYCLLSILRSNESETTEGGEV